MAFVDGSAKPQFGPLVFEKSKFLSKSVNSSDVSSLLSTAAVVVPIGPGAGQFELRCDATNDAFNVAVDVAGGNSDDLVMLRSHLFVTA